MQILKEIKHEYIENELWEFIEKHLLPLLSTCITAAETNDSSVLTSVLYHYIEELLLSIKETTLIDVSCEILLEFILLLKWNISFQRLKCILKKSSVDRCQVLCLRFEDLQDTCTLSYTKAQLVEVTKAMAGKPNIKHSRWSQESHSNFYWLRIPECLQE